MDHDHAAARRRAAICRTGLLLPSLLAAFAAQADMSAYTVSNASATITGPAAASLNFTIKRSGDLGYDAAVEYTTADGSADAGTDYTAASGSVLMPAGSSSVTLSVPVASESGALPDKQMYLQLLGATGLGPAPAFGSRFDAPAAANSGGTLMADFNGDGKPDLVSAYASGTSSTPVEALALLFNTTAAGADTPSFAPLQTASIGIQSISGIAVADFNGDGRPDVAVSAQVGSASPAGSVSVVLNQTVPGSMSAAFSAAKNYKFNQRPFSIVAADINGDGKPDLVVAGVGGVSIMLNTTKAGASAPSFATAQTFTRISGDAAYAIAVADLDGDGIPDIAATDGIDIYNFRNTTAPGSATVTLAAAQLIASVPAQDDVAALALADVDGDGKPDLVASHYSYPTVELLVFKNSTMPGSGVLGFLPAVQAGSATTTTPSFSPALWGIVVGDVNGDGKPDLIMSEDQPGGTGAISVFANHTVPGSATPRFAPAVELAACCSQIQPALGDLNGDGKADLAVAGSVWLNTTPATAAAFTLFSQQLFAAGNNPHSVTAADFNGDGKPDLALANAADNTVLVELSTTAPGTKTASFAAGQSYPSGGTEPVGIVAADMNLDGKPDLVVVNEFGPASVLLNDTAPGAAAASFAAAQTFEVGGTVPDSVLPVDLNGDGKPDLVVTNFSSSTHHISVYFNTTVPGSNTVTLGAQRTFSVCGSPAFTAAADFNGDGRQDLVVACAGGGAVLLNTTAPGAASASFASPLLNSSTGYGVTVADFNGDGLPDVAAFDDYQNAVTVFLNTTAPGAASASVAAPQLFAVGSHPKAIVAVDVDGDGRPDLLVANRDNNTIGLLLNTTAAGAATASFAAQQTFATTTYPVALAAVDLNGDGKPDIAVADEIADKFSVFLNKQRQTLASATPGTGTIHYAYAPATASLTPSSAAFPTTAVGTASGTKTFSLVNNGPGTLGIASVAASGDFAIASNACGASLAAGKSCAIKVTFNPTAAGARSGALTVNSNGTGSPDTAALSGTGR